MRCRLNVLVVFFSVRGRCREGPSASLREIHRGLEMKLDDLNYQEILQTLRRNERSIEQLQGPDNVVKAVLVLVAEIATAKAAKEEPQSAEVEFIFASEMWNCFKECLELFSRGSYQLAVDFGNRLEKASLLSSSSTTASGWVGVAGSSGFGAVKSPLRSSELRLVSYRSKL